MTVFADKAAARALARVARRSAHPKGADRACDHLIAAIRARGAKTVAGYMPIGTELDPRPAMTGLWGAGVTVCVPVIIGPAEPLVFHRWTPDAPMMPGPFGAQVPVADVVVDPDLLIVPMLAFDARGFRLGYGGGFYDRTIDALRARHPLICIGFAYQAQEQGTVPIEDTDQALDLIVTEAGVITPIRS